jgi:hypothetical protein
MKLDEINRLIKRIDSLKDYLIVKTFNKGEAVQEFLTALRSDHSSFSLILKEDKSRGDVKSLLDEIYECRFLNENYSFKFVRSAILKDIFDILRNRSRDYVSFKELFGKTSEECLVACSVCGIDVAAVKEIGGYLFFYSYGELDAKSKVMQNSTSDVNISTLFPDIQFPCVGVTVLAIDHEKAREKAFLKFRELENVVQFMAGRRAEDFFIRVISPDILHSQKSICIAKTSLGSEFAWKGPIGKNKAHSLGDPFFTNIENSGIWSLLAKKDISNWERKLIRSINWIGRSLRNSDINMAFLQMLFSLESLLVLDQKEFLSESITAKLSDTVAYVLSNDLTKRIEIAKQMKVFYDLRSKIVHFGSENISLSEFYSLFVLCKNVIISFFRVEELKEIKSNNDLIRWFNLRRYS